ncbi:MAG: SprB repeat-containing protein [Bacteroidales bacterium]|nr:SprB repeat-containing protein [Bacteroidales bacterium]MCF8457512.1 SprB repeat-containing protein [Bacteroidales bacterium]
MKTFTLPNFMLFFPILLFLLLIEKSETHAQIWNWQETITDNPCPGDSLGSIEISFTWFNPPPNYWIEWSTGAINTQNIYSLPAGEYSVTISGTFVGQVFDYDFTVGVVNEINVSDSIIHATTLGGNNGEIHLNASGGSGNYNYAWGQGETTSSISNLYAGVYYVTISDTLTCAADVEMAYYVNSPIPTGWEVTPTNTSHTIFIETSTCVEIGDSTLSKGSLIGVFREEGGQDVCKGYCFWNQQETMIPVFVPETLSVYNYYQWYETVEYKVYEPNVSTDYNAHPCCNMSYGPVCMNIGPSSTYGEISCIFVENSYSQTISLSPGWGTFSVALDPDPANFEDVFAPIFSQVKIIKDINGLVYWPEYNVNFLGNVEVGKGYQIKTLSAQSITVTGTHIFPEIIPLHLHTGWNLFGYYSNTSSGHVSFFSSGVYNLIIAKTATGHIYWPLYGLGYTWYLVPGESYWAKMSAPATFYLPPHNCNQ